jgi:hypothetical protein
MSATHLSGMRQAREIRMLRILLVLTVLLAGCQGSKSKQPIGKDSSSTAKGNPTKVTPLECPDLTGDYLCKGSDSDDTSPLTLRVSISENGETLFDQPQLGGKPLIADGKSHGLPMADGPFQYSIDCDASSISTNMTKRDGKDGDEHYTYTRVDRTRLTYLRSGTLEGLEVPDYKLECERL